MCAFVLCFAEFSVCLSDLCDTMKGQLNVVYVPGSCWCWPTMTASPPKRTQLWWRSPSSSRLSFRSSLRRNTGRARQAGLTHPQTVGLPHLSTCSLIYWVGDKQKVCFFSLSSIFCRAYWRAAINLFDKVLTLTWHFQQNWNSTAFMFIWHLRLKYIKCQVRIQDHQTPSVCSSEITADHQTPSCCNLVLEMSTDFESVF